MGKIVCLCGLPGSGKTYYAKKFIKKNPDYIYFSPDVYYKKINGDECNRNNTFKVWHSMFHDIHNAAINGYNVIIDSDNLTYAQRTQWIEWFPEFDEKIIIVILQKFNICVNRVFKRKRKIPYNIMLEKLNKFQNPIYDKNLWNKIIILDGDKI